MNTPIIDVIGFAAAVVTTLCWLPQAIHVIRTRETRAISLLAQASLLTGVVLWLIYGLMIGSQPLIWSNVVTFGLVAVIVGLKLRYG